jgi:hypothetical protein
MNFDSIYSTLRIVANRLQKIAEKALSMRQQSLVATRHRTHRDPVCRRLSAA